MLQEQIGDTTGFEYLDAGRLMASAAQTAGLDDFGDESFVEPLTKWLESIATEGHLTPMAAQGQAAQVTGQLVNRLRIEDDIKRHPEILDEDVSDPIAIIGIMRTGTTKLQRMMSRDGTVQTLQFWRLLNPAPFPGADPNGPDPRIAVAHQYVAPLAEHFPQITAGHPLGAEEADEDSAYLQMTFESYGNWALLRAPSYHRWWMSRSRQKPYEYLRRVLQYVQWQDGGRRGRPMVLKTPAHLAMTDLVQACPSTTFVHCHRDPTVAIASTARLIELFRRTGSADVDPYEIGQEQLEYWAGEMNRNLACREHLDERQVIDVGFAEICEDSIGVIQEIYRRRGIELSAEAESAMRRWQQDNPQDKHGKFEYSLDGVGLTRKQVEDAFTLYLERFPNGSAPTLQRSGR